MLEKTLQSALLDAPIITDKAPLHWTNSGNVLCRVPFHLLKLKCFLRCPTRGQNAINCPMTFYSSRRFKHPESATGEVNGSGLPGFLSTAIRLKSQNTIGKANFLQPNLKSYFHSSLFAFSILLTQHVFIVKAQTR